MCLAEPVSAGNVQQRFTLSFRSQLQALEKLAVLSREKTLEAGGFPQ
jgi:hypothetical protein